jgi:hypothetical protein
MALFKISKGSKSNLPTVLTEGFCWYTFDDSKFYIDFKDENGVLTRKALNAQDAETLMGASLATILNSSDVEIPTSKAVLDYVDGAISDIQEQLDSKININLKNGSGTGSLQQTNVPRDDALVNPEPIANAPGAVAFGHGTQATGDYAHAEGYSGFSQTLKAEGFASHAEGEGTQALGRNAHSEGEMGVAHERGAHVEGKSTHAFGMYTHAEGSETNAGFTDTTDGKIWGDQAVHAEGYKTTAMDRYSHAEGYNTFAGFNPQETRPTTTIDGKEVPNFDASSAAHAEGYSTKAYGFASHTEGRGTTAKGHASHAEGSGTTASGSEAHTEGLNTTASGSRSHAEGWETVASSDGAHAEGKYTIASKFEAHAEGYGTVAGTGDVRANSNTTGAGFFAHAEGHATKASGHAAHSEGFKTEALGNYAHASGCNTTVPLGNDNGCAIVGKYGTAEADDLFTVANGIDNSSQALALQVKTNGDVVLKSIVLTSENNNKFRLFIDDNGTLFTKKIGVLVQCSYNYGDGSVLEVDTTITFEEGMTWKEFINSKYNDHDTYPLITDGSTVWIDGGGYLMAVIVQEPFSHDYVSANDVIIPGHIYGWQP